MQLTILVWVLGILCLILLGVIFSLVRRKEDGAIVINKSDPMKDMYTLELYIPFGELDTKKTVVFKVQEDK